MKWILPLLILVFSQCRHKDRHADLVIHNAQILLVDEEFRTVKAMAIKDGKIIETGAERKILNRYTADEYIDAAGRVIIPAFLIKENEDPATRFAELLQGYTGQALTAQEAILTLTLLRARELYEDDIRGSLSPGKFANFYIMNGTPLNAVSADDFIISEEYNEGILK